MISLSIRGTSKIPPEFGQATLERVGVERQEVSGGKFSHAKDEVARGGGGVKEGWGDLDGFEDLGGEEIWVLVVAGDGEDEHLVLEDDELGVHGRRDRRAGC